MSAFIPPPIPKTKLDVVPRCTCSNCTRANHEAERREPAGYDLSPHLQLVLFLIFIAIVAIVGGALLVNPAGGYP